MEHRLFKPKSLDEGKHAVVGDCNGMSMQERYELETPLFADAILSYVKHHSQILDYGCGVGRLAKEILRRKEVYVDGVDDSAEMRNLAESSTLSSRFNVLEPHQLEGHYDLIYCVYVLQHVPAIEIREILSRIYNHLADDGVFVYCSSDYRMAIRFDNPGFFDDRFLGVNLRAEVERFFTKKGELFSEETIMKNPVLDKMIKGRDGGLPHPALVYTKSPKVIYCKTPEELKKQLPETEEGYDGPREVEKTLSDHSQKETEKDPVKLLLLNRLALGDNIVMTNAIRDLHKAYPGQYLTDVRSPCEDVYKYNPYITKLQYSETEYQIINRAFSSRKVEENPVEMIDDIIVIDMHYPLIHQSGARGSHFSEGHREYLEKVLERKIPQTDLRPELYLSQAEQAWLSPIYLKTAHEGRYWVLNAGAKGDYSLKQYPYYQTFLNNMASANPEIKFVQVGLKQHQHKALEGAIDLLGQTSIRELFRLIYHADGVVTCVSAHMHIAAAFHKPCVVVAGAREGTRWELYPNHQFLYVNGCLPCATYDGCWRNNPKDCNNKVEGICKCMALITPKDIEVAVRRYYLGGILEPLEVEKGVLV